MDVAHFANKRTEDENDDMGFILPDDIGAASSEEKLLHSYDRFYRAVSKVVREFEEDTPPIPSLDTLLLDVPLFPASHLETLKSVWQRAEGYAKLQKVVGKFHNYRSDVVRRLKRRSRPTSESPLYIPNIEEGMKEVLQKQNCMEQQLQFSNALLVGMEQRFEQFPAIVEDLLKKSRQLPDVNEQTALGRIVCENRQQIQRMEQMIEGLNAKLRHWAEPKKEEMSLPPTCWPETVHNNIVYSSSEGNSTIDANIIPTVPEQGASPGSNVPVVPQGRLPESLLSSECKAIGENLLSNVQRPASVPVITQNSSFEPKRMCEKQQSVTPPGISSVLNSNALSPSSHLDDNFSSSDNKSCSYSTEPLSKEASPQKTTCTENAVHDDEIHLNEEFHEAFLQDALLVQENIRTSTLGKTTEKDHHHHHHHQRRRAKERHPEMTIPVTGINIQPVNNQVEEDGPMEMLVNLMGSESISFLSSSFSEFCPVGAPTCPISILPNN